jgi:UDP-N-acetylmuramoylalanine--D-glutamate ligase
MSEQISEILENKKVLVLGYGREGISTCNYIKKHMPGFHFTVSDKNKITVDDPCITVITGEHYLDIINDYDIVIKSPGISVRDITIGRNTVVTCQLDLFLRCAQCKTIGITGTKGKTTTSTLTYQMLACSSIDALLIGNIGVPVLDVLDSCSGKVAVIEMGCHQLEFSTRSPQVAVITNIYPEHLDHYNGFAGYVKAKSNIVIHQRPCDSFICSSDQDVFSFIDKDLICSHIIKTGLKDAVPNSNMHLKGEGNAIDICYAKAASSLMGATANGIQKAVDTFSGIPHRMEYVGKFRDIEFYNDCIATVPASVILALRALENVDTLIIGGMDRGIDYSELIDFLKNSTVRNLICMPQTGYMIADALSGTDIKTYKCDDMKSVVGTAYKVTQKNKICLISPAAASYNRYKNFEEKGDLFKKLVKEMGNGNG